MSGAVGDPAGADSIDYMDAAARTAVGSDYKRRFLASLDVRPGQTVADLGCGPGTDLARLADGVGEDGSVIGVDGDARMLTEARRRLGGRSNVAFARADIHALPLPGRSVDRPCGGRGSGVGKLREQAFAIGIRDRRQAGRGTCRPRLALARDGRAATR